MKMFIEFAVLPIKKWNFTTLVGIFLLFASFPESAFPEDPLIGCGQSAYIGGVAGCFQVSMACTRYVAGSVDIEVDEGIVSYDWTVAYYPYTPPPQRRCVAAGYVSGIPQESTVSCIMEPGRRGDLRIQRVNQQACDN